MPERRRAFAGRKVGQGAGNRPSLLSDCAVYVQKRVVGALSGGPARRVLSAPRHRGPMALASPFGAGDKRSRHQRDGAASESEKVFLESDPYNRSVNWNQSEYGDREATLL